MAAAVFDHTHKLDVASWNWTSFNASQYVPSAKDLALAGPRMFMKLGSFLAVPEAVDNIFGLRVGLGQRIIPEATGGAGAGIVDAATTAAAGGMAAREAMNAGTQMVIDMDDAGNGLASKFTLEGIRSLGNVFSYATSKWALGCVIIAVVLNRTYCYASTRRNLVLPWKIRVLLRISPIILLAVQARSLLQSIQCQTSPDFGMLRWGNASKTSDLLFTQNGGFLHELSQTLLFGASNEESCLAVSMIPPDYDEEVAKASPDGLMPKADLAGSLSLLWPLFKTFGFSQWVETISCAVQGRQVAAETGMTLFEHSLAFAEADSQIGSQLGAFGSFGTTKRVWANTTSHDEATQIAITRTMIMKKVNTAPEVLFVGFLSAMNHLTSHFLAIFNLQGKLRLLSTGFWGLSFMSAIVWSVWTFSIDDFENQSLLRFPTVCIVGFIPHVLVLLGILACGAIYGAALLLSALSPPTVEEGSADDQPPPTNPWSAFMRRLASAHRNMQSNGTLMSSLRITMHMDFYTALLRTGFAVMTMASEAVYLNESRGVSVKQRTWLEDDRLRELETVGAQWLGPTFRIHDPDSGLADGLANNVGLVAAKDQPMDLLQKSSSGYAREMTAKKVPKLSRGREPAGMRNGIGATERSGRWVMALEFFIGINRLLLSWWASVALKLLGIAGIQSRPRWLLWLVKHPRSTQADAKPPDSSDPESLNFWLLSIDGELTLPKDENVDVEAEMRNRLRENQGYWNDTEEKKLDSNLYKWWLGGGWWGSDDHSGNFNPNEKELDEDMTSIVSFSTTEDEQDWISDVNDDGRRTPTQESPQFSRESTPFLDTPLSPADLAQLLHPKTPEQRAEAQALSAHLASDSIVTRSRYRNLLQRERAKVLTSTRERPENFTASSATGKLTLEEEAQILEHLIISRRNFHNATSSSSKPTSWAKGASGMGEGGPQCVVCQSSPRSIIVWPCRCLSLCDDCRVTLAMNNFDKCVCCRRDVASFSRIFVP
jgi:hypothetical protein